MVHCRGLYIVSLFITLLLVGCKTELVKLIPEIQDEEIQLVRDNRIGLDYKLSNYGYTETGVKYYEKNKPNQSHSVKAIRQDGKFYVELNNLVPSTIYIIQAYYVMDGVVYLSNNILEATTTTEFPKGFSIDWNTEQVKYGDMGEFQVSFEGEHLQNVNLKDLQIYLNSVELHKSYPVRQSTGKYKITVSGRYTIGYDSKQTIIIGFENQELLRKIVDFRYEGIKREIHAKKTNIISRYFVSVNNQFYNFDGNYVSTFNENNNSFEGMVEIPYYIGTLADQSKVMGDKIFFQNLPYSHILPNQHNDGNEIYSQSFDLKKKEFKVYYYGKHKWPTAHDYEHGTMFIHNSTVYQAYTISDFVNGQPTMPIPRVENYIARYNPATDAFEDLTTFSKALSSYKFISVKGELYAFALKDLVVQGYVIGKTLAYYKVNSSNFEFEEVLMVGDEYSPFSYMPKHIMEYDNKLLLSFDLNYHVFFDVNTYSFEQVFMRTPLSNYSLNDIVKHKGKYYLFADRNSTSGGVYEITFN
jgi:hypothetical protein